MNCKEFYRVFSEYHDGVASDDVASSVEAHLTSCASCAAYGRVIAEGVSVLRGQGDVEVTEDFQARLHHRLLHVDEEDALLSHSNSGATAVAVLSIALVLTAVAWSPMLRPGLPQVELSPLVVSAPPPRVRARPVNAFSVQPGRTSVPVARNAGLWDDAHQLLFEYSRLSQRYRQRALARQAGFEPDQ